MSNVFIVALAVALVLALVDEVVDLISIFIPLRLVNLLFSGALSYLGLFLLDPESIKAMVIKSMAASFLARVCLSVAEKVMSHRQTYVKQFE